MNEYIINRYLKIRFANGISGIYINDKYFNPLLDYSSFFFKLQKNKELLFREYSKNEIINYSNIICKDVYNTNSKNYRNAEYLSYCSSLQAWYESNYDTQLLNYKIAFTLSCIDLSLSRLSSIRN